MERPPPFDCAICGRHVENRWPGSKRKWPLSPVCLSCERYYAAPLPPRGSFRDRRVARQINALAEALETAAKHAQSTRNYHAQP